MAPRDVFALVLGSALLSWGLLEAIYAVYDRRAPRRTVEVASR